MALILVVDDEDPVRRVLVKFLELAGHEVAETKDGAAVVELYRRFEPDLILLDMLMPGMDGVEVVSRLHQEFPEARVIAVSGGGVNENYAPLSAVGHMGVRAALTKPFTAEEVTAVVDSVLNKPKNSS